MNNSKYDGMIPLDLLSDIKKGKCILFVGSGLSSQVRRSNKKSIPTWKSLLCEMLDWVMKNSFLISSNHDNIEDVKNMIEKNNLTMAAQELQEMMGNANLGDFYNKVFRDKNVKPSEVHKIIPRIPFRGIITTNYDTLIEGAYALSNEGALPPIFTQLDLDDKNNFLRNNDFFIFKMHGNIDRPDSIILGKKSYDDILFKNPTYRQFIETIFSVYTILFVGFGGEDDDLNNVFDKLSTLYSRTLDRNYMLVASNKYNSTEKKRLLIDRRIQTIEYKEDDSHSQVCEFFKELHIQLNRSNEKIQVFKDSSNKCVKVFLSSSFKDESKSKIVRNFLSKNDCQVWSPEKEMKPGDILVQEIARAIQESDIMVLLITENSIESSWVYNEWQIGIMKQIYDESIRVIPIVIGDVKVPTYINQVLYIKVKSDFNEEDLEPLLAVVKKRDW